MAFALLLVGISVGAWSIARAAQEAVLDSQSGSISAAALDPDAPGFRAFTEPTPTALVLHTSVGTEGGAVLSGVAVLAGGDEDRGGTIVSVSSDFVDPEGTNVELSELFDLRGFAGVADEMAATLAIGFGDVVVLDARSWTQLMAADLPLDLSLRDDLIEAVSDTESRLLLAKGSRSFDLAEIELIATHVNPDESPTALSVRQQAVWRAWISQTASAAERPELFSVGSGFVSLIGNLASGEVSYRTLPDTADEIRDLIAQIVPFPTASEPGGRPSVMLIDGTGGAFDRNEVLTVVVRNGGQVAILGNDQTTDRGVTEVQLHDPLARDIAQAIAAELGAPPPIEVPLTEATVGITVLVGADQVDGP